jgi:PAS domain S-box-containing protein
MSGLESADIHDAHIAAQPATADLKMMSAGAPAIQPSPEQPVDLQFIYDTAPIGLACLSSDCRYLHINKRLTEICGISVADHLGRSVRDIVPAVADRVEQIVAAVVRMGEPVTGIEVRGQRADKLNADHVWITNWHPVKGRDGSVVGVNVVAEEITERKRADVVLAASDEALHRSEVLFRELANNISQFAWMANEAGWIYWYNKRWHDYTGTTLQEMQGWGWQKVHHPDHVDRVVKRIRESFESGVPWEDTFPLRSRDGQYRWFLSRALPIRNAAGQVIRWFGTNTDITEQLEAETALRELNENLEQRVREATRERLQIWTVSQDLLAVADLEGKYLSVNPAWLATLGWSDVDLLGKTSQWLLHPDDREKTSAEIRHLAAGGKTPRFESRFLHKNGSYRWISWTAAPTSDRIYAMGRDITELKDAEQLLQEARRELAQVARRTTLAAMTASIAHEIGQPLTAIVSNAGAGLQWLARMEPDLEEAQSALKQIVDSGNRACAIITNTRAMFRKDGQQRETFSVNDLARDILALVRGELERHRVVLELDLNKDLPLVVGERVPLQQVLLNLIMNAAEAMSSVADRKRLLSIKTQVHETHSILITVTDCGTGIDPEAMDRIFEAFFTTKPQGMGMGLSICRSIVEAHDGRLWVTPAQPNGSTFHVQLPIGDRSSNS